METFRLMKHKLWVNQINVSYILREIMAVNGFLRKMRQFLQIFRLLWDYSREFGNRETTEYYRDLVLCFHKVGGFFCWKKSKSAAESEICQLLVTVVRYKHNESYTSHIATAQRLLDPLCLVTLMSLKFNTLCSFVTQAFPSQTCSVQTQDKTPLLTSLWHHQELFIQARQKLLCLFTRADLCSWWPVNWF